MRKLKGQISLILCMLLSVFILAQVDVRAEEEPTPAGPSQPQETQAGDAKEKAEVILAEEGGILLPKGTVVIEPSFNYTHFSSNLITISGFTLFEAIVIGTIQVEEIKRDVLTESLEIRYGLSDRLQLEAKIPYIYRHDRLVRPAGTDPTPSERTVDDAGLGDIEGGFSYHASRGTEWLPDVIINVKGKTRTGQDPYGLRTEQLGGQTFLKELPTGTGHYGLSGGVTLVEATDPVVLFLSGNYYWNFERNVGHGLGDVDPGNSIEYVLGMAVALSERISLSLSFQNSLTASTTQNSDKVAGSDLNAASTFLGASFRLSDKVSLFTSVGIGLTEDSPDFELQFSLPISL